MPVAANDSVEPVDLGDVLARRHMTRNFAPEPVERSTLERVLAAALRAPSAGNTQGCDLVVLEGSGQTARYWAATTDAAWRERSRRYRGLANAPVIVLPFADPDAYAARYEEPDKRRGGDPPVVWVVPYWHVDAAFATMAMILAATDAGLGVAFLGNFRGEAMLKEVLGVPEQRCWLGAVLLGVAARPDPPSSSLRRRRRGLDDVVHRGKW